MFCARVDGANAWWNDSWRRDRRSGAVSDQQYLLDTSAFFTLIENEAGAARVEEALRTCSVMILWVSLLEVASMTQQEQSIAEAERRYALIRALPVTLAWQIEEATLLTAARLNAAYRLSLADAIIAAYAIRANAILLHKDPEFETLSAQVRLEASPDRATYVCITSINNYQSAHAGACPKNRRRSISTR